MKRLTDASYWEREWWGKERPRRLRLYRDFDFETVRLLGRACAEAAGNAEAPSARLLELGAGGSRVLPYLAGHVGCRAFGADFSFSGCRLLRANFALAGAEGQVVCEDMFQSSLADAAFDVVFSSGLVEHFDETRVPLAAHVRLLKPGGRLGVIVPNLEGLQGRIWKSLAPPLWARHRVFGPRELAGLLEDCGLERVRSGYLGSFFIHIGRGGEWTVVERWPRALGWFAHYSVRLTNGALSFLFRLLPFRPHSKALSPAFFAAGIRPASSKPERR